MKSKKNKSNHLKKTSLLSFICIFLFIFHISTQADNFTHEKNELKQTRKKIIVGGDINYPPFEFIDENGNPCGYNVDLTKAIAKKMNLDIEIKLMKWDKVLAALENGQIDIIQGIYYSPKRAEKYTFSQYHTISHYICLATKKSGIHPPSTLNEMNNFKIGVEKEDVAHHLLSEHGFDENLYLKDNMQDVMQGLLNDEYQCAVVSRLTALYLINKNSWQGKFNFSNNQLFQLKYCYAVKKGNEEILAYFSEGIKLVEDSGEYNEIYSKWFAAKPGIAEIAIKTGKYIAAFAAIAFVILSILFAWNFSLQKALRKKISELEIAENKYKEIFELSRDGFVIVSNQGKIIAANNAYQKITGYSLDELKNLDSFYSITPAKWHKWEKEEIWNKRLLQNGWSGLYEKEYIRKDGQIIPVEIQAYTIFDDKHIPLYLWGVVRDITQKKKQETELRKRLDFEHIISRLSAAAISSDNIDDFLKNAVKIIAEKINVSKISIVKYEDSNRTFIPICEHCEPQNRIYENKETIVENDFLCSLKKLSEEKFCFIEDIETVKDSAYGKKLSEEGVKTLFCSAIFVNNKLFGIIAFKEYRARIRLSDIDSQAIISYSQIISNILDKFYAQSQEKLLKTAIEFSDETIVITDKNAVIEYVNPAFEKITGYSRDEAIGKNPKILASGKHDKKFYEELWNTISSGKTWSGRFINKRKNGELYIEDAIISPVLDQTGNINHFIAVKRDITERLKLEEQIHASQKMDLVGRLAGGVAHDFNNMLSVILGFNHLAMEKLKDIPDAPMSDLEQVKKAAERSAELTKHLLTFARKQLVSPKILNPNEEIDNSMKIIKRLIGEEIKLTWTPQQEICNIYIDPLLFNQIIMNLCVNARDAMDKTNRQIKISTTQKEFDHEFCRKNPEYLPGKFAVIKVEDNGCGMDENLIKNIFEPFFTTKPRGQGTGLGLSIVYGIVKQSNGFIIVKSKKGEGSEFSIFLPEYKESPETKKEDKTEPIKHHKDEKTGKNRILIVEDEESVQLLCTSLLKDNYIILTANSPAEAAKIAENEKEKIDLLLTDIIMPEMNGVELSEKLKKIHPEMKILFMSGYTADVLSKKGFENILSRIIRKPFTKEQLLNEISLTLNESPQNEHG